MLNYTHLEEAWLNCYDRVIFLKDCQNPEIKILGYRVRNKDIPIAFWTKWRNDKEHCKEFFLLTCIEFVILVLQS